MNTSTQQPTKAYLLLADGTLFKGESIGKIGTVGGEVCFNTGMTGYQEIYTDPSYYGQIVVNTNSHIGNYGTLELEAESDSVKIKGLIVKAFSPVHSRKQAEGSLQQYLEKANIVGIGNIDTRMLVSHIRSKGAMNAVISSEFFKVEELKKLLGEVPAMEGLELSSEVTTQAPYFYGNPEATFKVAVLDVGIKKNILRNFDQRDCYCQVFSAHTSFEEMEAWQPDGYFISNGPGDPASMEYAVKTIQKILAADKPLFGICLGQQLLALACGLPTYKMHNGHRGLNHPVKNLLTGKCEITSQNHGFGVVPEAIKESKVVEATHINLNDDTIEGIRVKGKKAFSVQYHPEAAPGPHDSHYLFDDFVALMKN